MLSELKVSHFAIIDSIHIHFNHGFNVLSGETGAGKSLLIKSLSLLMGSKFSSQDIRSDKKRASIEGVFKINNRGDVLKKLVEMGLDSNDGHLVVRRLLEKNAKSKVYLNGHLCTIKDLRQIVFPLIHLSARQAPLIEITGQHESKELLSPGYQMDSLDQFCGHFDLRKQVAKAFDRVSKKAGEIKELEKLSGQRKQQWIFWIFKSGTLRT